MIKGRVILLGVKPQKVHSYTMVHTVGELKEVTCIPGQPDRTPSVGKQPVTPTGLPWRDDVMRMMCSWYMQGKKPQLCEKTLYSPVLHRNLLWVVLYILSAHNFNSVPLSLFHRQSQTQHHLLLHLFQLCWWRESVCTRISLCTFFSHQKSLKSDDTPE